MNDTNKPYDEARQDISERLTSAITRLVKGIDLINEIVEGPSTYRLQELWGAYQERMLIKLGSGEQLEGNRLAVIEYNQTTLERFGTIFSAVAAKIDRLPEDEWVVKNQLQEMKAGINQDFFTARNEVGGFMTAYAEENAERRTNPIYAIDREAIQGVAGDMKRAMTGHWAPEFAIKIGSGGGVSYEETSASLGMSRIAASARKTWERYARKAAYN